MDPQEEQEPSAFTTTAGDPSLDAEANNENRPSDVDIVIAGVSCRLPESDNVEEFWQNLISGEDMVTEENERRQPGLVGLPKQSGKLKDLSRFDAKFFRVNHLQAHAMDPQLRILLEVTYEAIVDAGLDPTELRGSPTGVFVGSMHTEALEALHSKDRLGYGFSGGNGCMMSNYVSFCFDFRGPSLMVNTACAASLYALDLAVQSLRLGRCQYTLVAGSNILLKPATAAHLNRLRMLSPDGTCKAFDVSANGYARSEGIVAVLLTERRNARRAYLQVMNSRSSFDGYKPEGITYPSGAAQRALIQSTFAEVGVDPTNVFYVEAHGTGTQAGDYEECKSLDETLCRHRVTDVQISDKVNGIHPLLIGSVKSNMGHSEAASGLAGIVKVILAFRHGKIPANLHLSSPNPKIPSLVEGRLSVVTKAIPIPSTAIVSLNSFGFGGAISHVILRGVQQPASPGQKMVTDVTLAFPVSSRTPEGLEKVMDFVVAHRDDREVLALLRPAMNVSHINRGYLLWKNGSSSDFKPQKTFADMESSVYASSKKRPVWFVFCGMGSQWSGMGQDLLRYPIFRQSVDRCYAALPSDVKNIVTAGGLDESCTVLDETAAICIITLSLVELLKAVGVVPDGLIGHSLGEISACCADGCLTPIQAAQLAYWRTKCTTEAGIAPGAMASTGLTWEEAGERCPKGVWPACNNIQGIIKNVTVSGEKEAVEKFLAQLKEEGVFAKKIKSSGFAFHSPQMQPVVSDKTLEILRRVVPDSKRQSPKWIVTSVPPDKPQDKPVLCSAEFHLNSLTNPVFFHEAITKIPQDAVVVEIGPHALLQAILKKSLSPEATLIPLQNWKEDDQAVVFMRALGTCHNAGVSINPLALLEPVNFPVSAQTPSIGHLVSWDHSDEWFVPKPEDFSTRPQGGNSLATAEYKVTVDSGYKIDGAFEIPAANYLLLAWKTLAEFYGEPHTRIPVTFSNVTFHKSYSEHPDDPSAQKQLKALVSPISGHFEITEGQSLLASGNLRRRMDAVSPGPESPSSKDSSMVLPGSLHGGKTVTEITQQDIYKELLLKGYQVGNKFQTLTEASLDASKCQLGSTASWLQLLDAPFQAALLHSSGFSRPASIESVCINPLLLDEAGKPHQQLTLHCHPQKGKYSTLSVSFEGLRLLPCERKSRSFRPQIEKYTLQPYLKTTLPTNDGILDQLRCMMDVMVENTSKKEVSLLQIVSADADWALAFQVSEITSCRSMHRVLHNILVSGEVDSKPEGLELSGTISHTESLGSFNPPDVHHDVVFVESTGQNSLFATTTPHLLKKILPGGFLLLMETLPRDGSAGSEQDSSNVRPEEHFSRELKDLNFCHIATMFYHNGEMSTKGVLLLYRQLYSSEISDSEIAIVHVEATTTHQFSWIPKLHGLLARRKDSSSPKRIYCISEMDSANPSGLIGMINCLRLEPYGDRLRCLYLINEEWKTFRSTAAWQEIKRQDLLMNVVKDGRIGSFRHSPVQIPIAVTSSPFPPAKSSPSPSPLPTSSSSKFACDPLKVYVITGGLGGFGLELAAWLVERGAKHLVLTSRSGVKSGYQARKLGMLLSQGAKVKVSNFDVSDMNQAGMLVQKAVAVAKGLGGIFHLAGVLKDGLFENQSAESFEIVVRPKLTGAINLDRAMCTHSTDTSTLFVVFSSVASGFGNIGQSNYAFANSAMDRLCEQRQEHGLHGLAIQWGAIGGVGMLQEKTGRVENVAGTQLQPISSCLDALDILLNSTSPVISCYVPAEKSSRVLSLKQTHAAADNFKSALSHLIGLRNPDKMNVEATLGELGMDSVMSFEVTQLVEKDCGISLSKEELLSVKVGTLIEKAVGAAQTSSTGDTGIVATSSTGDFKASLCRILGLQNPDKLYDEATLAQLGLDSLMSFEINQLLAEEYDTTLTKDELLAMKVSTLVEKTSQRVTTVTDGDADSSTVVISGPTDVIASPGGESGVCSASSSLTELENPPKVTFAEE